MKPLKSRLKILRRDSGGGADGGHNDEQSRDGQTLFRQRLERANPGQRRAAGVKTRRGKAATLAPYLGGRFVDDGLIVIEETLPLGARHGRGRIEAGLMDALQYLGYEVDGKAESIVIMDTETTGLAGGTGTVVFLLGLAKLTVANLTLRQYFLTGFGGEHALLRQAQEFLDGSRILVTYNGKSFDYPLLQARYRLAGLRDPFADFQHLDLLHTTRRTYGRCWPDCRLQTVEQSLLGFQRTGDIPGARVPEAWFAWVRRGMARDLPRVVRHNRWDLLTLAVLPPILRRCWEDPAATGVDVRAVAGHWLRCEGESRAHEYLYNHRAHLNETGLLELARLSRRQGQEAFAIEIWRKLAGQGNLEALERLAKYYEHAARDLGQALGYTRALIQRQPDAEAHRLREARLLRQLKSRG